MKASEKTEKSKGGLAGGAEEDGFQVIDRRLIRLAEEEGGEGPAPSGGESETPSEALETKERELAQLRDRLLRLQADFDNFRKRKAQEETSLRQSARDGLLVELFPIFDNLERALQAAEKSAAGDLPATAALREGIEMVMRMWFQYAEQAGLSTGPKKGEKFDPRYHEAVEVEEGVQAEPDTVLEIYQRGYHRGTHVLRPAKVKVAAGPPVAPGGAAGAGAPPAGEKTGGDGQPDA